MFLRISQISQENTYVGDFLYRKPSVVSSVWFNLLGKSKRNYSESYKPVEYVINTSTYHVPGQSLM